MWTFDYRGTGESLAGSMRSAHIKVIEMQMTDESALFRKMLASPEAKEAFSAFFEKRKPDFSRFT